MTGVENVKGVTIVAKIDGGVIVVSWLVPISVPDIEPEKMFTSSVKGAVNPRFLCHHVDEIQRRQGRSERLSDGGKDADILEQ